MKNTTFKPKGKVLWDVWFIKEKKTYHAYHLQSIRVEDHAERSDKRITIGHAESTDLINWQEKNTVLAPGKKGTWDSRALWTGSVIKKGKTFYMFYTGRKDKKDEKWIQKIGLATSKDLTNWKKYKGNPVLAADNHYYDVNNNRNKRGKVGAFRDPHVFHDPKSKKYYMVVSARKKGKKTEYNACIALAESTNLKDWKLLPPIFAPNKFDEMEVSQMIVQDGIYYLFFSVPPRNKSYSLLKIPSLKDILNKDNGGLYCYCSKDLQGKYQPVNKTGLVTKYTQEVFALQIVHQKKNEYVSIGWLDKDLREEKSKQKFRGSISFPYNLTIKGKTVTVSRKDTKPKDSFINPM